ncbi:hypothetical protein LTS18_010546, partial [Coniosporium uncinatum]
PALEDSEPPTPFEEPDSLATQEPAVQEPTTEDPQRSVVHEPANLVAQESAVEDDATSLQPLNNLSRDADQLAVQPSDVPLPEGDEDFNFVQEKQAREAEHDASHMNEPEKAAIEPETQRQFPEEGQSIVGTAASYNGDLTSVAPSEVPLPEVGEDLDGAEKDVSRQAEREEHQDVPAQDVESLTESNLRDVASAPSEAQVDRDLSATHDGDNTEDLMTDTLPEDQVRGYEIQEPSQVHDVEPEYPEASQDMLNEHARTEAGTSAPLDRKISSEQERTAYEEDKAQATETNMPWEKPGTQEPAQSADIPTSTSLQDVLAGNAMPQPTKPSTAMLEQPEAVKEEPSQVAPDEETSRAEGPDEFWAAPSKKKSKKGRKGKQSSGTATPVAEELVPGTRSEPSEATLPDTVSEKVRTDPETASAEKSDAAEPAQEPEAEDFWSVPTKKSKQGKKGKHLSGIATPVENDFQNKQDESSIREPALDTESSSTTHKVTSGLEREGLPSQPLQLVAEERQAPGTPTTAGVEDEWGFPTKKGKKAKKAKQFSDVATSVSGEPSSPAEDDSARASELGNVSASVAAQEPTGQSEHPRPLEDDVTKPESTHDAAIEPSHEVPAEDEWDVPVKKKKGKKDKKSNRGSGVAASASREKPPQISE